MKRVIFILIFLFVLVISIQSQSICSSESPGPLDVGYENYSICNYVHDYVSSRILSSGIFQYNESDLISIKQQLNNNLLLNLKNYQVEDYIKNYNQRCGEVLELYFTPLYLTGTSITVEQPLSTNNLWRDYKYSLIFIVIIIIGVILFQTKKSKPSFIPPIRQWSPK